MSITRGYSIHADLNTALEEVAASLDIENSGLTCCFISGYEVSKITEVNLKDYFPHGVVVACTGAAVITPEGYPEMGVVATCIAESEITAVTTLITRLDNLRISDLRTKVAALKIALESRVKGAAFKDVFAMLLVDSLQKSEEKVASAIGGQLGGIPLCGGSTADNFTFQKTAVYCDNEWVESGSVLILAHTKYDFEVFSTQHYVSVNEPIIITRADPSKRVVYEINGLPAAIEYSRLIGIPVEELNADIHSIYALTVKIGGREYVRTVIRANEDMSLTFACAIDEGVVVYLARGTDMAKNLEQKMDIISSQLGEIEMVLGFNCAYRELEMRRLDITQDIVNVLSANKVSGLSVYGEQFNSIHVNQTFTGIAFGQIKSTD